MTLKTISENLENELRQLAEEICVRQPASPASVYRLQINPQFNFQKATALIPYLQELGIEAIYVAPYFEASPGSMHGYDVTNPQCINPELGSPEDFEVFLETLAQSGLKQILDVVPNHMGILGNKNLFWQDVLENGPSSIYAKYFDIDWEPEKKELKDKVLIPILGDHIGRVLERKEIQLHYLDGEFTIRYWTHELPVAPRTYTFILEYGIEPLKHLFGPNAKILKEFLSTITALKNLPPQNETDPELICERNREKEIIKGRLNEIYRSDEDIRGFIDSRVELFNGEEGDAASFDLLDELMSAQAYRMAYWRVAAEEINYRRFFDINELAAICIENDEVFEVYHQLLFQMIREGKVHGLRIDHPDGLYNPPDYFRKLQKRFMVEEVLKVLEARALPEKLENLEGVVRRLNAIFEEPQFCDAKPLLVVVEKILDRKESLPSDWVVHGTVGYDFLNVVNGLFIKRETEQVFTEFYEEFIERKTDFEQLTYEKKKYFALVHMASEINHLALLLDRISEKNRRYRDFTVNNIAVALREVIACFPVYRTYIRPDTTEVSERDGRYISIAIEKAKSKTPALSRALYNFLGDILLLNLTGELSEAEQNEYRNFILRFQQLTGPIMAKGLEDTAFYLYNRFLSLNEVGGSPTHFGVSVPDFHKINLENAKAWPLTFLASSTHDTKRSEDVRMRLNVLSEIPEPWKVNVIRWHAANEKHKVHVNEVIFPDKNIEYFIYQTLVGIWPTEDLNDEAYARFTERVWICVQKSIREAKRFTNWVNPEDEYEEAVHRFVLNILARTEDNYFLNLFIPFQKRVAQMGMLNSLSATVLKMGSPGIVDTYQGNEMLNLSLVDPDNRCPVDYKQRQTALHDLQKTSQEGVLVEGTLEELTGNLEDGRLKLFLTWQALHFRREHRDLFLRGDYFPLQVEGVKKNNVIAFLRRAQEQWILVAVARLFYDLYLGLSDESYENAFQTRPQDINWEDTRILLPRDLEAVSLRNVFSGKTVGVTSTGEDKTVKVSQLLSSIWVAISTPS